MRVKLPGDPLLWTVVLYLPKGRVILNRSWEAGIGIRVRVVDWATCKVVEE